MIIYGIKNCDTMKKALQWFYARKISVEFHDYKLHGISSTRLKTWSRQVGWESLLNRKGTTWRQLDEAVKVKITNESAAIKLMGLKPTLIRRPVVEEESRVIAVGFDEKIYQEHFGVAH